MKTLQLFAFVFLNVRAVLNLSGQASNVISMNYKNGIYTIPSKVNGLTTKFIFDSGASTTQIGLCEGFFFTNQRRPKIWQG